MLHGVTGGVPWVVSEIWMNVVVEEKRRGRVMAVYSMLVALGLALGPFVLQIVGVYGPKPFITCAVLALLVALPLLPYWKTAPKIEHAEDSGYLQVVVLAPLAMLAGFACGLGEQVAFSFLPVYAVGAGVSAEIGALWLSTFVIGNVVLQWPIGWMADHFDRRAVLAGCALASTLLVVLLSAVSAQSLMVIAVIALWGGLSFAIYPVGLALLGQRIGGGDIARANTAFSMLYILGGLVGRPLAGAAMDAVGDPGLGWTLAVFYSIAGHCRLAGIPPTPLIRLPQHESRPAARAAAGRRPPRTRPSHHPDRIDALRPSRARRCAAGRRCCRTRASRCGSASPACRASASRPSSSASACRCWSRAARLPCSPSILRPSAAAARSWATRRAWRSCRAGMAPSSGPRPRARPWAAWRGARARPCCWSRRRASTR